MAASRSVSPRGDNGRVHYRYFPQAYVTSVDGRPVPKPDWAKPVSVSRSWRSAPSTVAEVERRLAVARLDRRLQRLGLLVR